MKYLITGGAGFIGSHLTERLLARGDEVVCLDNLSTGAKENVAHLTDHPHFELVQGSPLDLPLLEKVMEGAEMVFHLAAAVGVKLVVKNPAVVLENIKISENVFEVARRYKSKVLITSTSEIYGKNKKGPLKETDDRILGSPLKSRWSYSTSKAVDEILAYTYYKQNGLPTIIVRLFNVVGPRQTGAYGMVIPRFTQQALKGEDITIYGTGEQSRCFMHVKDTVTALIKLSEHPGALGDVFNVGNPEEVTMNELARRIIKLSGSHSKMMHIPYNEAYEEGFEDMERRVPDVSKLQNLIGVKPTVNLEGILKDIIEYFRNKK